jgi:V/A-type H+-transporting ATPase subunit D
LQVYPAGDLSRGRFTRHQRSLMGVRLVDATFVADLAETAPAVDPSPEAERCRLAFVELVERAAALAAVAGNLERLSIEYQRSLRRARAIADVILPDLGRVTRELETRIEELEQEDAIFMSRAAHGTGS